MRALVQRIVALAAVAILAVAGLHAQTTQFLGSITAISGATVTVKPDKGDPQQFAVPDSAVLKRIEPGQKDLSQAVTIQFSDLAVGDRVLVRLDPSASTPSAARIVAIKAADLAQKQKKDQDDWQRRGIAGLVKSVDTAGGAIVVSTGAGPTAKNVIVKTTSATVLKRYAGGAVRFADAQPAPLGDVHPGDQLRARGDKNADGSELSAEDVVSGTFRNIAGTIITVDPASSSLTVKDLATKKPVTIHISDDAQMRRIPDRMAQMLAARLNGNTSGGAGSYAAGGGQRSNAGGAQAGGAPAGGPPNGGAPGGAAPSGGSRQGQGGGGGFGPGGTPGGGDPQRFLSMAPAIKLTDLQKGEAIMVVTTEGSSDVNAITLLAGVEALLQAPAATDLLSNWSMGGGGAEAAAGGTQ